MSDALAGIRIVDFSRQMAAPLGTAMLSDYGAEVIKVEALPAGDASRNTGRAYVNGESAIFLMWNRGKRSLALDLRRPESKEIIHRLVDSADVLVESYRPGVAEKIGIGYEAMSAINPRLVYVSLTAFGPEGPLKSAPGTDPVVQAVSGVMSTTGEPDGDPLMVGVPISDFAGALTVTQAVMAGLLARERIGRGQKVDVPMLAALLPSLTTRLASYWTDGTDSARFGSAHSAVTPYELYHTADGAIVAGVWAPDAWPRFCEAIDRADLVGDPRFATNIDRLGRRAELKKILDAVFAQATTDEWERRFREAGALFGRVNTISEAVTQPQVEALGQIRTVNHPVVGELKQVGPAVLMSETPPDVHAPPPLLGQHTREILGELGYEAEAIDTFLAAGIAQSADALVGTPQDPA